MLTLYRIDHIGQVVGDLMAQADLLQGLFGFRQIKAWENAEQASQGMLFDVPGSWGQRWEVLSPLGENSPLQTFLDGPRGPGLHHVAVEVPDMDAAKKELDQLGIDAGSASSPTCPWIEAPLSTPKGHDGLLFRLFGPPDCGPCCHKTNVYSENPSSPESDTPDKGPSLGIVAVEQIGQAHGNRDEITEWCEATLGMREVYRTPDGKHPDIATLVMTVPGTHMRWEIIQPVDEASFVQRYLDKRGPGFHHVTFEVADWDHAMDACRHHEIPTFGDNEGVTDGARWRDTFIHPRYTGGFLVQLFWEERPGAWSRSDKIPRALARRKDAQAVT